MQWTISTEHDGLMIRTYLQREHGFSRSVIKAIIYNGGKIFLNDEAVRVRHRLQAGDTLTVELPPEKKAGHMIPEQIPLAIIYEDDAVLVVNKPAQMVSIPSMLHPQGTVANAILGYYETKQIPYTAHIVTRLDRDTSGLLLVAKHRLSHAILSDAQKKGTVKRSYYAIIEGHLACQQGTINEPIGRKQGSIIERKVTPDGKEATTHYQVLNETAAHSLVNVQLETGRTHQIRVHFSHLGHPLAGDDLYGGKKDLISRQALHCYSLAFDHPLTKEHMHFTLPLADDMAGMFCLSEKGEVY